MKKLILSLTLIIQIALFYSCNSSNDTNKKVYSKTTDTTVRFNYNDSLTSEEEEKSKLKPITTEVINLCAYFEKLSSIVLPTSDGNLPFALHKAKLDSTTLSLINTAKIVSIDDSKKISGDFSDEESFRDDFSNTNNDDAYGVCKWTNWGHQGDRTAYSGFLILQNLDFGKTYLVTYKLLNQKENFINLIDAILINYHATSGSGGMYSYDRNAILYKTDSIVVSEDYYSNPDGIDRLTVYKINIAPNGKLSYSILKQEKRAEDKF
ncbi:MAG: hypothetical protein J7604_07620 [Sporocytophaga sp.]|uniref:hypothetical protein n=1 Tax=Sporocytophaga sp. TaxID=2231183 RepID=UPI001B05503E|nr:hypothetical protein [Sporocytophaga sp.]MBO9700064.1 hypothetical protein [Sporocytophaga sp.]